MDLKRLITHFTYRIEPKPEGGFIAHASDPTLPPLEATTREELQDKIQANIAAALAAEFPGLRFPLESKELKYSFHVERKPEGGFTIHSADPTMPPIDGATEKALESHFVEKFITFAGKHFMPELAQAMAAQGNGADIKIFVNHKTGFTLSTGSKTLSFGGAGGATPSGGTATEAAKLFDGKAGNANPGSLGTAIENSPIIPQTSSSGAIFRFLLALLIVAAMLYFYLHSR
jgi:hypothetical protein